MSERTKISALTMAFVAFVLITFTVSLSGCSQKATFMHDIETYDPETGIREKNIPISKPSGSLVVLKNYDGASDPTWEELISFIEKDNTDKHPYDISSFVCADFAEMLHNHAEKSGIKAGFVAIDIIGTEPHAINVFNTVDKGLVYVDCTGNDPSKKVFKLVNGTVVEDKPPHFDKIAYVVEGKDYGTISVEKATSPNYDFYEEYKLKWAEFRLKMEEYNRDVKEYNAEVSEFVKNLEEYNKLLGGRTVIPDSEEFERLNKMYEALQKDEEELDLKKAELDRRLQSLKAEENELGNHFWESFGVVETIVTYW